MSEEKKVLEARFLSPEHSRLDGRVPFLVFNQVDLRSSKKFFVIININKESESHIFRFTLEQSKISQTKLNLGRLPPKIRSEFEKTHQGICFSNFQFPTAIVKEEYCSESSGELDCFNGFFPKVSHISIVKGGDFSIEITFSYPDLDPSDYMRFFLITDPVGCLLAIHQRKYSDKNKGKITLTPMAADSWKSLWGEAKFNPTSLLDCPYILVFIENPKFGLFYSHIWTNGYSG